MGPDEIKIKNVTQMLWLTAKASEEDREGAKVARERERDTENREQREKGVRWKEPLRSTQFLFHSHYTPSF